MTPVDIARNFELLQGQIKARDAVYRLEMDSPLFEVLHPGLLLNEIQYKSPKDSCHGHYYTLLNQPVATPGRPCEIWKYFQEAQTVQLNFETIGNVLLSKTPLASPSTSLAMNVWLDYALSPDLWAAEGKWPRFHHRLHGLFKKYDLLVNEPCPGHYRLHLKAKLLKQHGFSGSEIMENYELYLPWDFSLTALKKLETIIVQEF